MNDFKEYSAAFHAHNNDIMHYGVKNMRWGHHKKKNEELSEEEKKKQQVKNAANLAGVAGSAGVGAAIATAVYDSVPKKKTEMDQDAWKNARNASGKKAPGSAKNNKENELLAQLKKMKADSNAKKKKKKHTQKV